MQVKDGASWVALEYGKWKKARGEAVDDDLVVVPAAIVYTNKSKYRSKVRNIISIYHFILKL